MTVHKMLMSAVICGLVAFVSTVALAEEESIEVITSQGTFPLDERGLPEKKTMTALFDEMDYQLHWSMISAWYQRTA